MAIAYSYSPINRRNACIASCEVCRYADYQQQRAPYRQTSQDAMQALRRLIGL